MDERLVQADKVRKQVMKMAERAEYAAMSNVLDYSRAAYYLALTAALLEGRPIQVYPEPESNLR